MSATFDRSDGFARIALLIFVAALALRLGLAFWLPEKVIWPDGGRYEKVALSVLHGQGFGDLVQNRMSVPTQPLLIAGVYGVFGEKNYLALRIVSAVLGAVSVLLGLLLARSLFGEAAAICTGVMLAGYPYLVYLSALFEYPQPLFILLMAAFFLLYRRFQDTEELPTLFFACVSLGIAVLTVPTALLFVPVFGLMLLARKPFESARRIGVLAAAMLLTIGSWATRNHLEYGQSVLINASSGWNFWVANNETYARYGKEGVVPPCGRGYEATEYCQNYRAISRSIRARGLEDVARVQEEERLFWLHGLDYMRTHPGEFVVLAVQKFLRLWSPFPDAVTKGSAQGGAARDAIGAATYIPLLVFGVAGLVLAARDRWRSEWRHLLPIYAFMLIFVAPFAIFLPTTRYRLPIDFLFAIFASYALVRAWSLGFRWCIRTKVLSAA